MPNEVTELLHRLERMLLNWSEVPREDKKKLWRDVHEQADAIREKFYG
jgi:ElaB/YqjD/DUF883 family membrane-anchored ribosome-binding protein